MVCLPRWRGDGGGLEMFRLAFPLILSNSFFAVQIFVDRVLLSNAHSDAVAASMPAAALYWMIIVLPQNVAGYASVFVAQYLGAGRPERVGPVVWQALYFSLAAGLAFIALSWLADPVTRLMGHSENIQRLEAAYFGVLCFAAPPALVVAALGAFFSGRGDTWTTLIINAVGVAVNLPLAYLLIYGAGGFPKLGIAGAGWALVTGTTVSAVLALILFLRPEYRHSNGTGHMGIDLRLFGRLLRFGFPNGLQWCLDTMAFNLFLIIIGRIGDAELTATSVALSINMLAPIPMLGIGYAIEILVGGRLGENRPEVAERSTWTGFAIAWTYMSLVGLAYVLIPDLFIRLFANKESPSWAAAEPLIPLILRFIALYCLFDSLTLSFSFGLRGAGDTRFVTVVSLVLSWTVMVIPTWLSWQYGWGIYWAWAFATGFIIAQGVTFLARFLQGRWKSMRVIEAAFVEPEEEEEPVLAGSSLTSSEE